MMRRLFLPLFIMVGLLMQTAPMVGQSTEQQWLAGCDASNTCQMQQVIKSGDVTLSHLLIYRVGKSEVLEFLVPMGVNLQKPPVIQVDESSPLPTQMLTCEITGCRGFVTLTKALRTKLQRGLLLKLFVGNYNTKQQFTFNYTLDGFTKSYATFSK